MFNADHPAWKKQMYLICTSYIYSQTVSSGNSIQNYPTQTAVPPPPAPHTTTENKSSVLKTAGIAAQSAQSLLPPDWASSSFSLFVT